LTLAPANDTLNGLAQHLTLAQRLRRVFRPRLIVHTAGQAVCRPDS
jgi:hypothetical protein